MDGIKQSVFPVALLSLLIVTTALHAQDRDLRAERLVLDDNGTDSTVNTVTIRTSSSLLQNVVLTIPDPGTGTAEFMLTSGSGGSNSWLLGGNSGTTPGTDFLGTTDSAALQLQVRGGSGTIANSLILNENGSLQRDTAGEARGAGAVDLQISRSGATQVAASAYSVIGGGQNNGIASTADGAAIGGGASNTISDGAIYSTIGGGRLNTIDTNARYAVIGAGRENTIETGADYSTIGGGYRNIIDSATTHGTIGGGGQNKLWPGANYATIGGGYQNLVRPGADHSTIGGGEFNRVDDTARYSTISGGENNRIRHGASYAMIGGGFFNDVAAGAEYSTIGGGWANNVGGYATYSSIGGGRANVIDDSTDYGTIGGGRSNEIRAQSDYSTIGGGRGNFINGQYSVIPGGKAMTLNADHSFGFLANDGGGNMTISESNIAVFGNADLWLANNTGAASQIRFYEPNTTTGDFPSSVYFTSFEAPSLGDTVAYILPAAKPGQTGEVLQVSALSGDRVTLTWGTVTPSAGLDGSDIPTAIAVPDDGSGLESRVKRLEAQLATREHLLGTQKEQIQALRSAVQTLEQQGAKHSSDGVESKDETNVFNAE